MFGLALRFGVFVGDGVVVWFLVLVLLVWFGFWCWFCWFFCKFLVFLALILVRAKRRFP